MFKVPKVKSTIFGLPLEAGTKFIGYIHVTVFVLMFILTIVKEHQHDSEDEKHASNSTTENYDNINITVDVNNTELMTEQLEHEVLHEAFNDLSASFFNDFALITQLTFAGFLLLGVYQKNLDYMLSWVLLQMANIIFSLFFVVVYFVAVFRVNSRVITYLICEEITVTLFIGYCVIIVNSHVDELIAKADDREEQMTPIVINNQESPNLNHRAVT